MLNQNKPTTNFLAAQLVILMVIWFVTQSQGVQNAMAWITVVARFTVYLLTARGIQELLPILSNWSSKRPTLAAVWVQYKLSLMTYAAATAMLVASQQKLFGEEFFLHFAAYLVCTYLQNEQQPKPTINYGTGMACSFFEGYLKLVIPSDGKEGGFVKKMSDWENKQRVVFPVKRLLLVVTKSLWCPPDLSHFNTENESRPDIPRIEPCIDKSLKEVKDVAGVKNRRYSSTIYRIYYPDGSRPSVYLATECATPLHTLHGVLSNPQLYQELAHVDSEQLVTDFCSQVNNIVQRSPACRDKCVLVHFDDTPGSGEYLPTVLLNKIEELEPRYLDLIARHATLTQTDEDEGPQKKVKITDRPKRPMSAYMLWINYNREQIKANYPGLKVSEIAKKGGEIWRGMKDKSVWEEKAAEAKEQYIKDLELFNANGGSGEGGGKKATKRGNKSDEDEDDDEKEDDEEEDDDEEEESE